MPTIKYTREDITKLENERDQYKLQRDELSNKLDEECDDNYKLEGQLHDMTKQRDELIKDVEGIRRKVDVLERENKRLLQKNNKLIATDIELTHYRTNYNRLTEHIKDKALNNPSEHRYFRLVHFIDDLEGGTDD